MFDMTRTLLFGTAEAKISPYPTGCQLLTERRASNRPNRREDLAGALEAEPSPDPENLDMELQVFEDDWTAPLNTFKRHLENIEAF